MKVASFNPEPEERTQHRCNVCGRYYSWSENHRHIERPVGNGYSGYEVYFITCSDECRSKARNSFIEWLSSFEGWSKKKAAENYDTTILKQST